MQTDNNIHFAEDFISFNRYNYCRGNPFKWVDPSGDYSKKLWLIESNAVGITNYYRYLNGIRHETITIFSDFTNNKCRM